MQCPGQRDRFVVPQQLRVLCVQQLLVELLQVRLAAVAVQREELVPVASSKDKDLTASAKDKDNAEEKEKGDEADDKSKDGDEKEPSKEKEKEMKGILDSESWQEIDQSLVTLDMKKKALRAHHIYDLKRSNYK